MEEKFTCNSYKRTMDVSAGAADVYINTEAPEIDVRIERHDDTKNPTAVVCLDCLKKFMKLNGACDAEIRGAMRAYKPQVIQGDYVVVDIEKKDGK